MSCFILSWLYVKLLWTHVYLHEVAPMGQLYGNPVAPRINSDGYTIHKTRSILTHWTFHAEISNRHTYYWNQFIIRNIPCKHHINHDWCNLSLYLCVLLKEFVLTHWGPDKMTTISQTTSSNAFSWMEMCEFRLRIHWSLFLRAYLTIFHYWFRQWLGAVQATSHYLKQWWLDYWRIMRHSASMS